MKTKILLAVVLIAIAFATAWACQPTRIICDFDGCVWETIPPEDLP